MHPALQKQTPHIAPFADSQHESFAFYSHAHCKAESLRYDFFDWAKALRLHPGIASVWQTCANGYREPHRDFSSGTWYAIANGLYSVIGLTAVEQAATHTHPTHSCYRQSRLSSNASTDNGYCESICQKYMEETTGMHSGSELDEETEDAHSSGSHRTSFTTGSSVSMFARPPSPLPDGPQNNDITAQQVATGTDIQGIPWERLPLSREDYRATRLREGSRRDAQEYSDSLPEALKEPNRGGEFYDFFHNARRVKCSIVHFQLRNLAWATSKHDVFVMHDAAVVHWNAAARQKSPVLDLSGSGMNAANGLGMVQISTMIAKDDLVVAGGFYGEMVAKNLRSGALIHNKRITYDENAITNAIDIFEGRIMTSNNDCYVRCFDIASFEKIASFRFSAPVNHATRQPGGKMVAVAGDTKPIQVIDGDNGDRIAQLRGHEHFSFATGWHPNGQIFATGSQDRMCRIWDVRNMAQSFGVLAAHIGAVRSLRFSSCGKFLFMAEPRDFVHIYDVNRGEFDVCQEVDLFGEIAGIALTPGAEALFVAVNDRTYSSLLEYERKSNSRMVEFVF